jgi:SAM-dependent methyltransferase
MSTSAAFFVDAWAVYRLIVEHDYLWHSHVGAELRRLVPDRARFLDLACGDADTTSKALTGRPVGRYVGVDQSPDALAAAARNVAGLGCPTGFVTGDYLEYLEASRDEFDAIYVGLSAHHLDEAKLARFFAAARPRLAPGGVLAAYEPFLLPDETRAEHIDRLCAMVEKYFVEMTPAQRAQVAAHVRGNDLPVTVARWDELAAAGFGPARRAFKSPDRLYELVVHYRPA